MANKKVSPQRQAEIKKEKDARRKDLEDIEINDILSDVQSAQGDRHYAREFKKLYVAVRKGLALLENKRKLQMATNEETYNQAVELLNNFVN